MYAGLILDLRTASERRRCKLTPPLIGYAQNQNQPYVLLRHTEDITSHVV